MDKQEIDMRRAIAENPLDLTPRFALADYWDENGLMTGDSMMLRLSCEIEQAIQAKHKSAAADAAVHDMQIEILGNRFANRWRDGANSASHLLRLPRYVPGYTLLNPDYSGSGPITLMGHDSTLVNVDLFPGSAWVSLGISGRVVDLVYRNGFPEAVFAPLDCLLSSSWIWQYPIRYAHATDRIPSSHDVARGTIWMWRADPDDVMGNALRTLPTAVMCGARAVEFTDYREAAKWLSRRIIQTCRCWYKLPALHENMMMLDAVQRPVVKQITISSGEDSGQPNPDRA